MLLRRVFSTVFWTFLAVSCIPLFVVALLLFLITFPFDRDRRILHLYSCAWAQLYFWVNPLWRLNIEGRERLPWKGAAVLVSNHESLGDILVLFGLFRPFKWVSKHSVFKVPFVGWNMRLNGYVGVIRGERESVLKMMADCERWLARGVPVLLFPEGTRSPDGNVQTFRDGAFHLAVKMGCPVIPIALVGTGRVLPKHGFLLRDKVHCRVQVMDPVDPSPFKGDVAALREHVRALIIEQRERMDRSTRQ